MSFLNELKLRRENLNKVRTLIRHPDGILSEEDIYSGDSEVLSMGLSYVVDNKPNLTVTPVIDGLLMGSQDVAFSEKLLTNYGINCVISLGIEVPRFDGIKYVYIEVLDLPEFNIINIFQHSFSVIDSERKKRNIVYVHCNAGISRSASLVIGYLMKECNMDFKKAFDYLKCKRPSIRPNEGFIKQLLEYERISKK